VLTSNLLTISLGELKWVQLVRPLWVKEKAMNEFRSEQVKDSEGRHLGKIGVRTEGLE
jgi:hypothetical protein